MTRRARQPLPPGFGTIWTTVAIDLVGFGIVLPILPVYAHRFHASPLVATLLLAAFSAASFVCSPLWGRLSDRVGRKPVLLVSLVGTAVGSLLTGLAGGLVLLFVGRVVDGMSGASVSVAQAAAADVATAEGRTRLFGLLGAAFGLGFVAGPALGALAALGGPRLPFLVAAGISGVNAIVAIRRLPETHHPQPEGEVPGDEGRRVNPLRALAQANDVVSLLVVAGLTLLSFSAFEATFSLLGERRLGWGVGSSAGVFAVIGLVIVLVEAGLAHVVVPRFGEIRTLRAGLVGNVAGLALVAVAHSWALLAPALLLLTVGQGLVQVTMSSALAGRAGARRRGRLLGAQQSVGGLARVIGPLLGGVLFGQLAVGAPAAAGAVVTAVALLLLSRSATDLEAQAAPAPKATDAMLP